MSAEFGALSVWCGDLLARRQCAIRDPRTLGEFGASAAGAPGSMFEASGEQRSKRSRDRGRKKRAGLGLLGFVRAPRAAALCSSAANSLSRQHRVAAAKFLLEGQHR